MKTKSNPIVVAAIVLLGLAALGCGEHDLLTGSSFVKLSLSPDSTTLFGIGESPRLTLSAQDASGNSVEPRLVRWISDDTTTVRVHQDGTITALREGKATITASVGSGLPAKTTVIVDALVEMTATLTSVSTRPVTPMTDSLTVVVYDKAAPITIRTP